MVKPLSLVISRNLTPRVIGFDDAPFPRRIPPPPGAPTVAPLHPREPVKISGIITAGTTFEGMVHGTITPDGLDATDHIASLLLAGKFLPQIHAVMLDGITMGGLNVVDLAELSRRLDRTCIAVMRRPPDIVKMRSALERLPDVEERLRRIEVAGPVHCMGGWVFQFVAEERNRGMKEEIVVELLERCTPKRDGLQKIPECLRVAHLVNSAIQLGESTSNA